MVPSGVLSAKLSVPQLRTSTTACGRGKQGFTGVSIIAGSFLETFALTETRLSRSVFFSLGFVCALPFDFLGPCVADMIVGGVLLPPFRTFTRFLGP
jgi:hypothetical protein